MSNVVDTDAVLTFIFLKKLMTPITKTKAYSLELVDNMGRIIKQPKTNEEKNALTLFDKLIFKMKRLLKGDLTKLHSFLYLQTMGSENNFYNKLIVKGSIDSRVEIKRIQRDLEKIAENHECSVNEMLYTLIGNFIDMNERNVL